MTGTEIDFEKPNLPPDAQYLNKDTYLISGTGGKTVQDQYMFRLAEAYLLREFGIEEKRLLTLQRTGTMYDRIMAHNEYYNLAKNSATGEVFQQKYTLLPIPLSAIEANKDAVLEQNHGY